MKGCEKGCKELRDNDEGLMRNKSRIKDERLGMTVRRGETLFGREGQEGSPPPPVWSRRVV